MTKKKSNFRSFLKEWDTGALTSNVLQSAQMYHDPKKQDKDKNRDWEAHIHQELINSLDDDTNQDDSIVVDPERKMSNQDRILTHLKNLLFREPGYSSFTGEDQPQATNPSPNDHEIFNNGKELMNMGEPVVNSEYSFMDDPNNPRKYADASFNPNNTGNEEKHNQLIAAIGELRDELRKSRGDHGAVNVEQEEQTEEDQAADTTQYDAASKLFPVLINQKMPRAKIIAAFERHLGVTNSTAISYYQKLAKQAGLTNSGDHELAGPLPTVGQSGGFNDATTNGAVTTAQVPQQPETNVTGNEVPNNPNKQGLIRHVDGAHLVYKRQNEEGTYDELWIFGTGGDMEDALKIRRNILAGTDIPPRATKSANGQQSYTLKTLGNGQILHIKGQQN